MLYRFISLIEIYNFYRNLYIDLNILFVCFVLCIFIPNKDERILQEIFIER